MKTQNSAYCLKCRTTIEIKDPREIVMKNDLKALTGSCPLCGFAKVYRILGKNN